MRLRVVERLDGRIGVWVAGACLGNRAWSVNLLREGKNPLSRGMRPGVLARVLSVFIHNKSMALVCLVNTNRKFLISDTTLGSKERGFRGLYAKRVISFARCQSFTNN